MPHFVGFELQRLDDRNLHHAAASTGVVASDFSGISHRQRKAEQPDGRTGLTDELMLRSVGQLLEYGDAHEAAVLAAMMTLPDCAIQAIGEPSSIDKCRGSAGTTDLGLPTGQELARPSPGLRDTSYVTYAEVRPGTHTPCVGRVTVQAGFLTRGSLSCPRLPGREPSGNLEENSPLTVAGAAPGSRASSHRIPLLIQVGSGSCTRSFKSKGAGVSIAHRSDFLLR